MKRFMGMMPSDEIEKTVSFKEKLGSIITIDAGPNGWTITYADGSTIWKDNEGAGTEENYKVAAAVVYTQFGTLEEIKSVEEG